VDNQTNQPREVISFFIDSINKMSTEEIDIEAVAALRKKRQFKKFTYRGLELEKLLDMTQEEFCNVVHCRARRRLQRGLKRKHLALKKKLLKAKAGK
jgi:small subunit ribosomal protein S15e